MKIDNTCTKCGAMESFFNKLMYRGVCGACNFRCELFDPGTSSSRENDLLELFEPLGRKSPSGYDCIVPARGDAEDYFVVKYLLEKNINPLVVLVNNYFLTNLAWKNFHNLITEFDVDSVVYNPNLHVYKEAVRSSLRKLKSIYYPYKALLHSYVMQLAKEKSIRFVVWGQCQPIEFSGKYSKLDDLRLSEWWVIEHELGGVSFEDFLGSGVQMIQKDVVPYNYPKKKSLKTVQGIFLSNYLNWDQCQQNRDMVKYGFTPDDPVNTFDRFENAGSSVYYQLHDLLRFLNTGYPKLAQHFSREVRFGRMSLSDIDTDCTKYLAYQPKKFFTEFLETTNSGYEWFLDKHLTGVAHLLRDEAELCFSPSIPSVEKNENFVLFRKGI